MLPATRFTESAAVNAWDSWFRWRDVEGLRDRTIDATWLRVADSIAAAEGIQAQTWAYLYVDAFSHWQLLPDERLLRLAGTGIRLTPFESPCATLNVAAFVIAPLTPQARFDSKRFCSAAALAVRFLDDALVMMHGAAPSFCGLRIGVIGLADALQLLGIRYEDKRAADLACVMGEALANGTLQAATELAQERGPIDAKPAHLLALWRARGTSEALIKDAMRRGVRHTRLTAIEPQPRLALLSNNASDAIDPQPLENQRMIGEGSKTSAQVQPPVTAEAMMTAQLAIRAAIQPWIDVPIDYPLAKASESDQQTIERVPAGRTPA